MPKESRLEVIQTGSRRRWTLEEKRRIVAESDSGTRPVSATARRYGLSTGQLFTGDGWRARDDWAGMPSRWRLPKRSLWIEERPRRRCRLPLARADAWRSCLRMGCASSSSKALIPMRWRA